MTKTDFQIILEVLTIFIGLYLAFFKSYFQEKGKNIATKEDIEEITEKIEKVKSDIGILTHKKINLSTEKQNSLLDFNNKYSAWLSYILHVSIIGDSEPASIYVTKIDEKLDQLFYDFVIAEAKIDIFFIADSDLISLKNDIKIRAIELSNHVTMNLIVIGSLVNKINLSNKLQDHEYKMQELNKYYNERDIAHKIFQKEKLEKFNLLANQNYNLAEIISHRIHDFENK